MLGGAVAVQPTGPGHVSAGAVSLGPLALEQRLGLAVTALLFEVAAHRVAAVMPDDRAGAEAQPPTALAQAPADVDVVARRPVLRIESVDCA